MSRTPIVSAAGAYLLWFINKPDIFLITSKRKKGDSDYRNMSPSFPSSQENTPRSHQRARGSDVSRYWFVELVSVGFIMADFWENMTSDLFNPVWARNLLHWNIHWREGGSGSHGVKNATVPLSGLNPRVPGVSELEELFTPQCDSSALSMVSNSTSQFKL